jgi:hypothetical protein
MNFAIFPGTRTVHERLAQLGCFSNECTLLHSLVSALDTACVTRHVLPFADFSYSPTPLLDLDRDVRRLRRDVHHVCVLAASLLLSADINPSAKRCRFRIVVSSERHVALMHMSILTVASGCNLWDEDRTARQDRFKSESKSEIAGIYASLGYGNMTVDIMMLVDYSRWALPSDSEKSRLVLMPVPGDDKKGAAARAAACGGNGYWGVDYLAYD